VNLCIAAIIAVLLIQGYNLQAQDSSTDLSASVAVNAGTVIRTIPASLYGSNVEWVWNAYSLWNQQSGSADPNLVSLADDLGISLFRYPGGMYADFYHWQDGVGPYYTRPIVPFQTRNTQTGQILFGTDEALQFAEQVNAQLVITVNVGTGTPAEAAAWVRYVNGPGLRVLYWEIGNEVYINDGSVTQNAITMDPATYAARFLEFAEAMRAADPRIKIGAIGGQNQGTYELVSYPDWNQIVLQTAGSQIDFLAVHNSYAPVNVSDSDAVRNVYAALLAAPRLIAQNLQALSQQINEYAPARASQITIAVTEWGPLFQLSSAGRYAQHTRTLGSALFDADTLMTFLESPSTQLANFHVFNDLSIMCWICSSNGSYPPVWTTTAESMAFQLIRQHFGTQLVSSSVVAPSYTSPAIGDVVSVPNVPYLDVVSSLSADGTTLYIVGVNKHFDDAINASLSIGGFVPESSGVSWTLNGTGIDANTGTHPLQSPGVYWAPQAEDPLNPQFDNGGPGQVTVTQANPEVALQFTYRFPAHSVTVLQLRRTQ
jgi:alpha-L-arabinofuranosidase